MNSSRVNVASLSLALLLTLAAGLGQQPAWAAGSDPLGLSGVLSGIGDNLSGSGLVGGVLNAATGVVGGITGPVFGALGSVSGGLLGQTGLGNMIGGTFGGGNGDVVGNALRLASGSAYGASTGINNAVNGIGQIDDNSNIGNQMAGVAAANQAAAMRSGEILAASEAAAARSNPMYRPQMRRLFKRQAMPDEAMMAAAAAAAAAAEHRAMANRMSGAGHFGASAADGMAAANGMYGPGGANMAMGSEMMFNPAAQAAQAAHAAQVARAAEAAQAARAAHTAQVARAVQAAQTAPAMAAAAAESAAASQRATTKAATEARMLTGAAGAAGLAGAVHVGAAMAENAAMNQGAAMAQNIALNTAAMAAANTALGGRPALAVEAVKNAQAESAAAGAEMVAHGAVNARSASIASNAYRQAKLASARDRVDIAGTIQNSARISDAAIATHDAATKAEDSLLGSELAVDSASTVLDSDAAYIPPVTSSLLRSLPYGRLGLRNIIPKPLTHPSVMLPDVWLNGVPVNYFNVPLRMLPYGIGPAQSQASLGASAAAMASGAIINGQPFVANNGLVLNGLVFDPAYAYLAAANLNGIMSSSLAPILANGQLEAQDELAVANSANINQLNGAGMADTYQGYGRLNPVPMLTGSVTDMTLLPTTTIGTTYPIGSALVIEPRDSYFQDYTDNASSRQNMDERQQ